MITLSITCAGIPWSASELARITPDPEAPLCSVQQQLEALGYRVTAIQGSGCEVSAEVERPTLTQWVASHPVRETMFWKEPAEYQFTLFAEIGSLVGVQPTVISTHRSKSIELPVVRYDRPDLGAFFVIRGNFYDYKLSVRSERPIDDAGFADLFATAPTCGYEGELSSCYFEGFPEELVFGHQSANPREWSAEIGRIETLRAVLTLCMEHLTAPQTAT